MASYRDQLVKSLLDWPYLFLNQDDVIEHLFFCCGNAYKWENGQLVEEFDSEYPEDKVLQAERADPWGTRIKNREHREYFLKFEGASNNCYFQTPSGGVGKVLQFSSYDAILHLPDDIQPDWLAAARIALEYARSDRVIVPESEMGYLVQAEIRLRELEAMKSPIECPT